MKRRAMIESLLQRKIEHDWQGCCEAAFRILYGLPADVQLRLSQFVIKKYLGIFSRKWPAIVWPAQLLKDVNGWIRSHGRSVPSEPNNLDPADSAFLLSLDALLLAASYTKNKLILTSSCMTCICSTINAIQSNIWMADDPEGVELWKLQGYFPERSVSENKPAAAAVEREWEGIAAWLTKEEVWQYDDAPAEDIERDLVCWKDHEMQLIIPQTL